MVSADTVVLPNPGGAINSPLCCFRNSGTPTRSVRLANSRDISTDLLREPAGRVRHSKLRLFALGLRGHAADTGRPTKTPP